MAWGGRGAGGFQAENDFNVKGAACHVGCLKAGDCSQSSSATNCHLMLAVPAQRL